MKSPALLIVFAAAGSTFLGCNGDDPADRSDGENTSPTVTSGPTAPGTNSSGPTTDPTTVPTTSSAATTTESPTTTAPPATTAPPVDVLDQSLDVPAGTFVAAPGDAIVLGVDGDLELRPRLIGTTDDPAVPLVDNPDPRDPVAEGPGPNVIEDVAGIVNGSLIYSDCCEPVSGNLYALPGPGAEPVLSGVGLHPALSPDARQLAAANDNFLQVVATADGNGAGRLLTSDAEDPYRSVVDVGWTSDDEVVLLSSVDSESYSITAHDPTTLEQTAEVPLEVDASLDDTSVRFAGNRSDGMLAVAIGTPDQTTIRFVEPGTLALHDDERTLPADVTAVEFAADLGLLWVDDEVLYRLPPDQFVADRLASGVRAAWPLTSS
jgi:hypothetical protein